MSTVSDAFLLTMAEVSSGLVGLFLVGIFFFIQTGFSRFGKANDGVKAYFKASTRIILILLAIPLGLSFSLVVLEDIWSTVVFVVLGLTLVAANIDTAVRVRTATVATHSKLLLANEVVGTVGVIALVSLPWVFGGLTPGREDLAWAILLAFATGFLSICTLVLSAFDVTGPTEAGETETTS
jgi:hypothetical protein